MKRVFLFILILILLSAGAYGLFVWQKAEAPSLTFDTAKPATPVHLVRTYEDGVLTLSGAVTLPNACQTLEAISSTSGTAVRIDITISPEEGICLQRKVEKAFEFAIETIEGAAVEVYVHGEAPEILTYDHD